MVSLMSPIPHKLTTRSLFKIKTSTFTKREQYVLLHFFLRILRKGGHKSRSRLCVYLIILLNFPSITPAYNNFQDFHSDFLQLVYSLYLFLFFLEHLFSSSSRSSTTCLTKYAFRILLGITLGRLTQATHTSQTSRKRLSSH